ncbi:MAG: 2-C-methyl-D-erythritol 4-phosphate cytidylyltransferase [Calditrichaeota bacterium]|nr:MAG: 2-C-methyl-D-erythritol 4-phosphate cytidylyltransferase [Calditrichota bacterium]
MSTSAIIVAAGCGSRIGGELPKQYQNVCGKPLLFYALQKFEACPLIHDVVLSVAEAFLSYAANEIVDRFGFSKVKKIIAGGEKRQDSVYAGLNALEPGTKMVAIHDAARPFVSVEKIEEVIKAGQQHGAAILAIPAKDTIKTSRGGFVGKTPERDALWLVQTPQVFEYDLIRRAYEEAYKYGIYQTDDSALVERTGHPVKIVEGEPENLKITVPFDLKLAEMLLRAR